jgi:hypothetical protein
MIGPILLFFGVLACCSSMLITSFNYTLSILKLSLRIVEMVCLGKKLTLHGEDCILTTEIIVL